MLFGKTENTLIRVRGCPLIKATWMGRGGSRLQNVVNSRPSFSSICILKRNYGNALKKKENQTIRPEKMTNLMNGFLLTSFA